MNPVREQFGDIDIYLFDQILKGRIRPGMRILDAGCGGGRNLVYLLGEGFDVFAADVSAEAVAAVRAMGAGLPDSNFRVEPVQGMTFPDGSADVVILSAVLHFAGDDAEFGSMLMGAWRVLRPGGLFFCRLASTIGVEGEVVGLGGRRYRLMDGSERYLVDAELLREWTGRLGAELADPIKTTVVQDLRAMTTWVMWKGEGKV
jgi:SAM-dependent methyltransferase